MTYRKPGRSELELRIIDPYHLANINGEWYLFAYDHGRKDIRTFAPARIQSVNQPKNIERPTNFPSRTPERQFWRALGRRGVRGCPPFQCAGGGLDSRKKWHESQQLRELKDGGAELRMKLSSLQEIERWVLSGAATRRC